MNKLYNFDLYDKSKLDMNRKVSTVNDAWITSGYVIAENIEEAKEKIKKSFRNTDIYITNFDLGESFMREPYYQDNKNSDVFIEKFLFEE